jgi:dTDP-glucose 4,6-dehydratase
MSDILVTGGCGFIGSELVRQCSAADPQGKIYVLDKMTYAADEKRISHLFKAGNVKLIKDDIRNIREYSDLLESCEFIFHFAAESHVDNSIQNGVPFVESNVMGTYSVLNEARKYPDLTTIIVSTDEVYGSLDFGTADEYAKIVPSSTYSASKASADLLALANYITFGQRVVVTRACNNYGPMQNEEKFIPTAIKALSTNQKIPLYGTGENVREWIHISDHVAGILKVANKGKMGDVYNIGTGTLYTNLEIAKFLSMEFGHLEPQVSFVADRLGHDFRYALNSDKIRNELDWEPKKEFWHSLRELIPSLDSRSMAN